jgi:hypothetical protein
MDQVFHDVCVARSYDLVLGFVYSTVIIFKVVFSII